MSKFSYEEKIRAVQLVEAGETIGSVSRQTGISERVLSPILKHCQRNGPESLKQHRYDWSIFEKLAILRHMDDNRLSTAETSIQFGIKGASTVWSWDQRYLRYGMAGLESKKRGRPKKWRPPDDTMTREEQLEAENLYLRAENAYLKKLNALVAEREKQEQEIKQRLSRN